MNKITAGLIVMAFASCNSRPTENAAPRLADPSIGALEQHDVALKKPAPGDWLYDHHEPGQSFDQYIKFNFFSPDHARDKIYIQPIGRFTNNQKHVIDSTSEYLHIFFDLETLVLPVIDDAAIPELVRRYPGTTNEQLKTGSVLDFLQRKILSDGFVMMAVTSKDLYPDGKWNFVFGQARPTGRVSVSSLFRYTDAADSASVSVSLQRLIKTSSHEIGHMLSFAHCTHAVCLMNGSNSLLEADGRPNRLCSECLRKLQWNLRFDVRKRAVDLSNYFARNKLWSDCALAVSDLKLLQ